jgi:2-methylcitrate dehydratase PrpD
MILRSWAEQLLCAPSPPGAINLHVKDTVAAFVTGLRSQEGRALAQLYGRRNEPIEIAAAAAGISRLSECDDIHLASCVTPGAIVIPVALCFGSDPEHFERAVSAGYATGLTLGLAIGGAKALAAGVWPTLIAAPAMAAVTASVMSGHNAEQLAHAIALSLSGVSGRLGRPAGTPSGRWFAIAEAVAKGLRASQAAGAEFHGDLALISKAWLESQAGHGDVAIGLFESAPAVCVSDVGFKPFPIARQGANAVIAFQRILARLVDPSGIEAVEVFLPAANVALVSRPLQEDERLSRLSNMGYQLGCAALAPELLHDAERGERPGPKLFDFARRVSVKPAGDLDAYFPARWPARVAVNAGGVRFEETVIAAPFDHDAPKLAELFHEKWARLAPEEGLHGTAETQYAKLWQRIERLLTAAA